MLVYPERGLELNESAAAIAKRCDGTRTVAEIAALVVSEVEGDSTAVAEDVLAFIDELTRKGLLER